MSDDDILMDTIRAANADEEQVDDQVIDSAEVEEEEFLEGEQEEEPVVLAGKYNSVEDLENAYKELEKKFHESRQPEPQQIQQTEPKPYFGPEPKTESDLVAMAEQDPTKAAMFVLENADRLPEELANAVVEHWWTMKPWEATQYWFEQRLAAEREDIQGMTNPLVEQHERAVVNEAFDMLLESVPDYADYQEQVEDFIEKFDVTGIIPVGSENDPVALAEGVGTIVGILKWREYQEAMRNQGMMIPDQEPVAPPKVSTRNTTNTADMGEDDMDDLIRNMILNA